MEFKFKIPVLKTGVKSMTYNALTIPKHYLCLNRLLLHWLEAACVSREENHSDVLSQQEASTLSPVADRYTCTDVSNTVKVLSRQA